MNESAEKLLLEHLRHIESRVDQIAEDLGDLKQRMSNLENALNLVRREIALSDETGTRQRQAR